MSFSNDVKTELCLIDNLNPCCENAQLYGLSLFGSFFASNSVCLKSENKHVCDLFTKLSADRFGLTLDVSSYKRQADKTAYSVKIINENDNLKFIKSFGHKFNEVGLKINRSNFDSECCIAAFLRGSFLSCATITNPNSDYHIEFKTKYLRLSEQLTSLIKDVDQLNISPSIINKKGCFIVHIKGAESVADMLTFLGAYNSVLNFIQVKMLKEIRNNINRTTNFETANMDRTIKASVKQINAINLIKEKVGIEYLDEPLQRVAKIRLENPESSLSELCKLMGGISRSGLNHRLNKIIDKAKKLK